MHRLGSLSLACKIRRVTNTPFSYGLASVTASPTFQHYYCCIIFHVFLLHAIQVYRTVPHSQEPGAHQSRRNIPYALKSNQL